MLRLRKSQGNSIQNEQVISLLSEISQRLDRLEGSLSSKKNENPRKLRIKQEIVLFLSRNKSISSLQLSKSLGLSRTRSNEYLRELEKAGIAEGVWIGKKKVYRIRKINSAEEFGDYIRRLGEIYFNGQPQG